MLCKSAKSDSNILKKTCSILKMGGIIAYPTDTIYGFGCDALNENAIHKLNSIKRRVQPMSVLCPNIKTGLLWMDIGNKEKEIAKIKFDEGNTLIVPIKKNIVSKLIMGKDNSLGIRIPNHDFCKRLSKEYINPITTTSVNRSGSTPHIDPNEIKKEFENELDLLIDDGVIIGEGSIIHQYKFDEWIKIR